MHSRTYLWGLAAFLIASPSWALPINATVCEIHEDLAKFDGLEVSVRGSIYASEDITNISDPQCPGVMIQLSVGDDVYKHRDVSAFEKGLRKYGMRATATIVGTFHAKAPVHPYPMPAIDVHALQRAVFEAK